MRSSAIDRVWTRVFVTTTPLAMPKWMLRSNIILSRQPPPQQQRKKSKGKETRKMNENMNAILIVGIPTVKEEDQAITAKAVDGNFITHSSSSSNTIIKMEIMIIIVDGQKVCHTALEEEINIGGITTTITTSSNISKGVIISNIKKGTVARAMEAISEVVAGIERERR